MCECTCHENYTLDTLIPKVFITKTDQCEYRSVCPIAKYLIESTVK